MRRPFFIGLLLLSVCAHAQLMPTDHVTLADQDLMGTSRYVGMAGAMAAVGGDPSAACDNPAGWGLYRRGEISLTFDCQWYVPANGDYVTRKLSCGQASWNGSFLKDRLTGVVGNSLAVSYRRLKNYNREYSAGLSSMDYSLMDVMALKTEGLKESALQSDGAWNNEEIGWLSKTGYETYLINPKENGSDAWAPANSVAGRASVNCVETGSLDEFKLDWAMNISNRLYVGLGMGIRSLDYSRSTNYSEYFVSGESLALMSYTKATGVGVNASLGLIYRPTAWLRLGAAYHSPTLMALKLSGYGSVQSAIADSTGAILSHDCYTPDYSGTISQYTLPMRSVVGVAFQLGTKGMVSLEYDYQHHLNEGALDNHWLKAGAEMVVGNNWFMNVGYAFRCNQLNRVDGQVFSDPVYPIGYSSVSLNTQLLNLQQAHYVTAGVSFRNSWAVVGLAYQCRLMTETIRMHELQPVSQAVQSSTHKMVLTLALRR